MSDDVKGFFFMHQYYETFRMLPGEDRLALIDVITKYAFEGKEPDSSCSLPVQVAFTMMRSTIDGSIRTHQARSEAGKKGGAPAGNKNAQTSKNKQNQTKTSEKEKEKEKDKEKEIEKENEKETMPVLPDKSGGVSKKISYTADFEKFYQAYPRHVNKQDAFRAFTKVIKKVPPGTLIEAVEKQKAGEWKNTESRYIPYPSTWLNKGGWENETSASGRGKTFDYECEENSL